MINEVLLILARIILLLWVVFKFLLEKVVMPMLARTRIVPSVREEVVWTETNQVEFADIGVIKVVPHL